MISVFLSLGIIPALCGLLPTDIEMTDARRWVSAKFEGVALATQPAQDTIEVISNHGPVQPNARSGEPLLIGAEPFISGLYCHAPSRLVVRLSKPARLFEAVAGIDARSGGGSVVFLVTSGDAELWNSGLLKGGAPGLSVSVPLNSASEFILEVTDGGDGISSDQADWADARVTLDDGTVVWLGNLPITEYKPPVPVEPFFSFNYGGAASDTLLPAWGIARDKQKLDDSRTRHTLTYTDPQTGLELRCEGVEYHDFPVVEWTLYFRNTGPADTPVLSDILAMDALFPCSPSAGRRLHHNKGDDCTDSSYEPRLDALEAGADLAFANTGGRPTQEAFPYFNVAGSSDGMIFVVGWAGQWNARFTRDANGLTLRGGQEGTHFILHPGEEVRTPLIAILFYDGEWIRGQNLWRAWMLAHNMPRRDDAPLKPQVCLCTGNYYPDLMSNAAQEIAFIQRYVDEGIKADYWWQDAGWYPCDGVGWPKTGTWEVDPVRFPKGLIEVGDFARTHGMGTLVWFEPERVHAGTWLAEQHPEWIHGGAEGGLLKLGDPACRAWLTDHVDRLITEQRIEFYRQDFNMDPLPHWRAADTAEDPSGNRQGIAEIRHVEGYLAYWDELLRRHPGMPIDSCASGGRRNDLETLRRAVPLLRSDWYWGPAGQQCHTYGLSLWFPFTGTGVISRKDVYWMRSSLAPEFTFGPDAAGVEVIDFEVMRRCLDDWRALAPFFFGDFYPLSPYTRSEDQWMAWQYDRPDMGGGAIQAFRRKDSVYEAARCKLRGLDAAAVYRVTGRDGEIDQEMTGATLMNEGLLITLPERPRSALLFYQRAG